MKHFLLLTLISFGSHASIADQITINNLYGAESTYDATQGITGNIISNQLKRNHDGSTIYAPIQPKYKF